MKNHYVKLILIEEQPNPYHSYLNRCTTGKQTRKEKACILTLQMFHGVIYVRHIEYVNLMPFVRYIIESCIARYPCRQERMKKGLWLSLEIMRRTGHD